MSAKVACCNSVMAKNLLRCDICMLGIKSKHKRDQKQALQTKGKSKACRACGAQGSYTIYIKKWPHIFHSSINLSLMYSIVVVTGQHDHKKDDDTVLQTLKIIQDQHRPLETSFSLFSDLCRNPKRRPNLIKISRESNLSKTDDRPRSRHRHNKESTREPTSALMHQTFIHFSTFHLKQYCNNQKAEELVLITVVFKMYLSRFHCR